MNELIAAAQALADEIMLSGDSDQRILAQRVLDALDAMGIGGDTPA